MSDLHKYFLNNNGKVIHKWIHYFDIYEKHFSSLRSKPLLMFEIGVFKGGSLEMWNSYFGNQATIVGIDINPESKVPTPQNTYIEIGDQSDTNFLQSLIDKYGIPDIVLDDGSHMMKDLKTTFEFLYPRIKDNGIYLVEDLHTCYWGEFGGGLHNSNSFMEYIKDKIDELHAYYTREVLSPTEFTKSTQSISIYDSIAVFEKRPQPKKYAIQTGHKSLLDNFHILQ